MKYLLIALSITIFPFVTKAQQTTKQGFIVTSRGDTLNGMVQDRKFGFNDVLLDRLIILTEEGKKKKIRKKNISAYRWGDDLFVRTQLNERLLWIGPKTSADVFVIVEADGPVRLYRQYYNDVDNHTISYVFFAAKAGEQVYKRLPAIGWKGIVRNIYDQSTAVNQLLDMDKYRYFDIPELIDRANNLLLNSSQQL